MKKKTTTIINTILFTILGIVLLMNLIILFQAKTNDDKVPAIFGYKPFIVMSGSMETSIYTNDLIFVKSVDPETLKKDDVIAFRAEDDVVVTHRIIDIIEEDGVKKFITKGDNNPTEDNGNVELGDVEGLYVSRIPKLGGILLFIEKPIGIVVSVLIAVVVIFIYVFINMSIEKGEKSKEDEEYRKEFEEFKKNNPHKN